MSNEATLALQKAIINALRGDSGVVAVVGQRSYDAPPSDTPPAKPYVTLGPVQVLPDKAQDYQGSETTIQVDGWSEGPGSTQVKRLGRAIRDALDEAVLTLDDNQRLVSLDHVSTQYLVDPDGLTQHAVVTFQALTEPSA